MSKLNILQTRIKAEGYDGVVISAPEVIKYYTGIHIHPGERLYLMYVSASDKAKLLVNALFPLADNDEVEICYYSDTDQPIATLAQWMNNPSKVGIDKYWPSGFLLDLMNALPNASMKKASTLWDQQIMIKNDDDIAKMRASSLMNDDVMDTIKEKVRSLKYSEKEIQGMLTELYQEKGGSGYSFTPLICYGVGGSEPHHESDDTRMESTGGVIVDIGGIKDGYCSDMTRSFHVGQPSQEYVTAYNLVLNANLAAIAKVKPGVSLADIDKAARDVITEGGYGEFFTHRTGHNIGMEVHEYPDVSASSTEVCQEGMIFSIEPGIYLPGKFGIRIEDLVVVTKDGVEVLNKYPKALEIL